MSNAQDLAGIDTLLNDVHEVFLQENTLLKASRLAEHTALMQQKSQLLARLDGMLLQLKQLRESKAHSDKEKLRMLQDRMMQLLLLDRENEQLLLKQSVGNFSGGAAPKVSAQTLNKLYKAL